VTTADSFIWLRTKTENIISSLCLRMILHWRENENTFMKNVLKMQGMLILSDGLRTARWRYNCLDLTNFVNSKFDLYIWLQQIIAQDFDMAFNQSGKLLPRSGKKIRCSWTWGGKWQFDVNEPYRWSDANSTAPPVREQRRTTTNQAYHGHNALGAGPIHRGLPDPRWV